MDDHHWLISFCKNDHHLHVGIVPFIDSFLLEKKTWDYLQARVQDNLMYPLDLICI